MLTSDERHDNESEAFSPHSIQLQEVGNLNQSRDESTLIKIKAEVRLLVKI